MQELNMTGNSLKGARPLLSFDATFESSPHWLLVKEMLTQVGARMRWSFARSGTAFVLSG